jgi:hypothetical protein
MRIQWESKTLYNIITSRALLPTTEALWARIPNKAIKKLQIVGKTIIMPMISDMWYFKA